MHADVQQALETAANKTGVPYEVVEAVSYFESRHNPKAVSSAGAKGLMQIMPINFEKYGITDPFDPVQNAYAGASMIRDFTTKFGSLRKALAAYVWGPARVKKGDPWPKKVENYVDRVLARVSGKKKRLKVVL
jgi:soluble lytic murein transglycosylase-like protein